MYIPINKSLCLSCNSYLKTAIARSRPLVRADSLRLLTISDYFLGWMLEHWYSTENYCALLGYFDLEILTQNTVTSLQKIG